MTDTPMETEAAVIAEIARYGVVTELDDSGVWLASSGQHVVDLASQLERRQDTPDEARGQFMFHEVVSFVNYVNRHSDGRTHVYLNAKMDQPRIATAVFDDHDTNPGWGRYTADLVVNFDPAYLEWVKNEGLHEQTKFAEFVEDHLPEFIQPDGATLLEITQTIMANSEIEFVSHERLHDGNRKFVYRENTTATAGQAGELEIPETFRVGVPIFEGGKPVELAARLRYRLRSGALLIGFKLDRPQDAVTAAKAAMHGELYNTLTPEAYMGAPAATRAL